MKAKRAAVYVRVSTTDQHTDLQETELREYCEHRGWQYRVYRDAGQSGAKDNRPALTEMTNDIRRRKIDVIAIWALDRLARSLKHLLTIAEGKALGVDIVCLKQNIDATLPAGRLMFQVLGAGGAPAKPVGKGGLTKPVVTGITTGRERVPFWERDRTG